MKRTEAKARVHGVCDLAIHQQLGAQRVQLRLLWRPGDDFALVQQGVDDLIRRAAGLHLRAHLIGPLAVLGLFGGDVDAVCHKVVLILHNQAYIAVDAGAGVPPGAGEARVHLHKQSIFLIRAQEVRDVMLKGGKAVFPLTCLLAVHIQGTVHVHPVKAQEHALIWRQIGGFQLAFIPAHSALIPGLGVFNLPVMRQRHRGKIVRLPQ